MKPDVGLAPETRLVDVMARRVELLLADRHADDLASVAPCGVDGEGPPSAADVEQTHARPVLQSELAADEVVLRVLRLGERHPRTREARAGVGERGTEDQLDRKSTRLNSSH